MLLSASAGSSSLSERADLFRAELFKAIENNRSVSDLSREFDRLFGSDTKSFSARMLAYYSGIKFDLASRQKNAADRIRIAEEALSSINEAVKKDAKNIEARFIRFYYLSQMPAIEPVKAKLEEDVKRLYSYLSDRKNNRLSSGTRELMVSKLVGSGLLAEEQMKALKGRQQ